MSATERIYSIYKITNTKNNKCYIGKTKNKPANRFRGHKKSAADGSGFLIHKAIRKHGVENFLFEVIDVSSKDDASLNEAEIFYINKFESKRNGYNMTLGGEGVDSNICSDTQLRRIRNGVHPWVGEAGSLLTSTRLKKAVEEGTHPWCGEKGSARSLAHAENMIANGTHPWMGEAGSEANRKRALARVANGTHPFLNPISRKCPHCGKEGKGSAMLQWHFNKCRFKEKN